MSHEVLFHQNAILNLKSSRIIHVFAHSCACKIIFVYTYVRVQSLLCTFMCVQSRFCVHLCACTVIFVPTCVRVQSFLCPLVCVYSHFCAHLCACTVIFVPTCVRVQSFLGQLCGSPTTSRNELFHWFLKQYITGYNNAPIPE